ncbi:MAG: hypothetical protein K8S98_01850 [Planctomycetes bacterium]|nr:hypothetical protein [Planctomycetota bacterium]
MRVLAPLFFVSLLTPSLAAQEVTEERVRAAFADARAGVESVLGVKLDATIELKLVEAKEAGQRVADENLPMLRLRQPDEDKARAEADRLGDAYAQMLFAKYAWSTHEFLVITKSWNNQAKLLARPELGSDHTLRAVMVHELVHALDDGAYDLGAILARTASADTATAVNAIIEGHAQFAARRVCTERGWSDGFDTLTNAIGAIPESTAKSGEAMLLLLRVQSAQMTFAYHDGERFVAALDAAGGRDAIARAFREPPLDGETIMHPEWYLDPTKRPAVLYELEPALDLFAQRFPADVWTTQRLTLQSAQIAASLTLLPEERAKRIVDSIRAARMMSAQPTKSLNSKLVAMVVLEFDTDASARAYVDAVADLGKIKDEKMKTGAVRITSSTSSTVERPDVYGGVQEKKMKSGFTAFDVASVDVGRGKLVVETVFSGETLERDAHVAFAVDALNAVRPIAAVAEKR